MKLTLQHVFDNAVSGVYHQGRPAYRYNQGIGSCVYRMVDDKGEAKCAIGHSIPDALNDESLDGAGGITDLIEEASEYVEWEAVADLFRHLDAEALDLIQRMHDDAAVGGRLNVFIEGFLGAARDVQYRLGLTWPRDVPLPD